MANIHSTITARTTWLVKPRWWLPVCVLRMDIGERFGTGYVFGVALFGRVHTLDVWP